MSDVVLSVEEIQAIVGPRKRPSDQLSELRRLGYWRAWRARGGKGHVILERPHYEAVKSGRAAPGPLPVVDVSYLRPSTRRNARPIDWEARTALYRHFDKNGALLYIGIAVNPGKRESTHRSYAEWADKIHRVDVEWLESRHAAVAAERAAIAAERPKFNILHQAKC